MTEWDDLWEGKAIWEANEETLTWIMKVKSVGDKMKAHILVLEEALLQISMHKGLVSTHYIKDEALDSAKKIEAIREIVNRVDTDSDKVYNVKKALDK